MKPMWLLVLSICMISILHTEHALSEIYYVAQQDAAASDNNPGTAEKPWETISKAASILKPGDTVFVHAGTYRELVRPLNMGEPDKPITYAAFPGEKVIITGADILTGWLKIDGNAPVYMISWDHLFAIDWANRKPIEYHPDNAPLWGRAEQMMADGNQLLPSASLADLNKEWDAHVKAGKPAHISPPLPNLGPPFAGMFYADTANKKMYVWLSDGSDPSTHQMEGSTRGMIFAEDPWSHKADYHDIHLRGFTFRYAATFPQRPAVWLHGMRNQITDCIIEQTAGGGVELDGELRHCVIRDCGQTGGCAMGKDFLNEDCLWEDNCWKPIDRGWDAGGVKIANCEGGVFQRCIFRKNGGPGLWFDIDVRHVTVTHCIFDRNEGSGLFIEISRNNTVTYNLAVGNATDAVGKGADEWSSAGIQLGESMDNLIAFNTCVGNKDGIAFREQGPRPLNDPIYKVIPYHDYGDVIIGNVCAQNKGYQLGLWYDNAFFGWHPAEKAKYKTLAAYEAFLKTIPDQIYDPTKQNLIIDRNLYYAEPGQNLILYGAPWRPKYQVYNTLKDFSAKTGFDLNSQVGNPLFILPSAGNYRFQPNSPALQMRIGWDNTPIIEK
jgi:hypothetical protein